MRKSIIVHGWLLGLFLIPGLVSAESFLPLGAPAPPSMFYAWPSFGFSPLNWRAIRLAPNFKVGYEIIGLNINVPVQTAGFVMNDLDISLEGAGLYVGSAGLDLSVSERLRLFMEFTGSAEDRIGIRISGANTASGVIRLAPQGKKARFWEIDSGAAVYVGRGIFALVGFKADQFSVGVDAGEVPTLFGGADVVGDIKVNVFSPYFGAKAANNWANVRLTCSPWVTAIDARVPIRMMNGVFSGVAGDADSRFKLSSGGAVLLEAIGQTDFRIAPNAGLNIWAKAGYVHWTGKGKGTLSLDTAAPVAWPVAGSDSESSHFNRYMYGLGVGGRIFF